MRTFFFLLFILSVQCRAQVKPGYFQQELSYDIQVALNDKSHILRGFEKIKYTNRSSDSLKFIFMHVYPNAYRNDRSEFAKQQVENGETAFYYSHKDQRGFIDSLEFKVDEVPVGVSEYNNFQDVLVLELNEPLAPNTSIEITTPFRVVLPEVFSRMGHSGYNYQITQWYPKPAVYDKAGWHPMTYLDQGEFYSDFADYKMTLTLPEDYWVAANAQLKSSTESDRIKTALHANKANGKLNGQADSNISLPSVKALKTIQFEQKRIHDLAWVASRNFKMLHTTSKLASGKEVECYVFYLPQHVSVYQGSELKLAEMVRALSDWVGEYPYEQVVIVDAKLLAGGGMEYPGLSIIGQVGSKPMLHRVMAHEVAHNWFYGVLASNEREHPWMDEGMTTFYERKLVDWIQQKDSLDSNPYLRLATTDQWSYFLAAKQNQSQPCTRPAEEYSEMNYGASIYEKTSACFDYLEGYLGKNVFQNLMQAYYQGWSFKHPDPQDFRKIAETMSGKSLDWFFNECLGSSVGIDFKFKKVERHGDTSWIFVTSRTDFKGPVPVTAMNQQNQESTEWIDYPYKFPARFVGNFNQFQINVDHSVPERRINNNRWKKGVFPTWQPALRFGLGFGLPKKSTGYVLPGLGYNAQDKLMAGLVLHNLKIPNEAFQFAVAPMYSFTSKSLVGTGIVGYSFFPKSLFREITVSVRGNSFHHSSSKLNINKPLFARHLRISPAIEFDLKQHVDRSTTHDHFYLRYDFVRNQEFKYAFNAEDSLYRPNVAWASPKHLFRLGYRHEQHRTLNPFSCQFDLQGNQDFLKMGLSGDFKVDYHMPKKGFYIRAFAGKYFYLNNNELSFELQPTLLNATYTSYNDWMYEGYYPDRSGQDTWLSQQVDIQEGGLKVRTLKLAAPLGRSDNWLVALNLKSDLPFKFPVPIQLFFDAATFSDAARLNPSGNKILFDAGAQINLLDERISVYVPLLMSRDFNDYSKSVYTKNRLLQNISFRLRLSRLDFLQTQEKLVKWFF